MNEEDGFAAIEFPKESVKRRIGDAFSEDGGAGSDAYHSEFVERAGHLSDRRFYVRKGRAGECGEPLRIFANNACVEIVAEPRRIHGIIFVREIRKLTRDGEDLQVHFRKVHVAEVRFDAAEPFGGEPRFAKKLSSLGTCVAVQAIQVFDWKIVRVDVDPHGFSPPPEGCDSSCRAGESIHRPVSLSIYQGQK